MPSAKAINRAIQAKDNATSNNKEKKTATQTITEMLGKMSADIKKATTGVEGLTPERFQRIVLTAWNVNPKLKECTPISFLAAAMQSAQLGLEPNTPLGQAYIIPYKRKAKFIIGYKGWLTLLYRSGEVRRVEGRTVYANDEFDYEYGTNAYLYHKPTMDPKRGNVVALYTITTYKNGEKSFYVMYLDQIEAIRKKFSHEDSQAWKIDYEAMALKTVLKRDLRYAPLSVETREKLAMDETIKSKLAEHMAEVEPDKETFETTDEEPEETEVKEVKEISEEDDVSFFGSEDTEAK